MKASIVDLRYKTKQILQALDRKEEVTVLYHGKVKGIIRPATEQKEPDKKVAEHAFFGMIEKPVKNKDVLGELRELRKPRYDL